MDRLTGTNLGTLLCKALGLDASHITKLTIEAELFEVARVEVELIPTDEQGKRIVDVLTNEEYIIVKETGKHNKRSDSD